MTSVASLSTPRVQNGTLYFVALLREELGRRIAAARTSAGLSQQQLAAAIGLKHAQDISRYERGKVEVPSHRIDLIAEATGRPRSYFVRDPSEPEPTATSFDAAELAAVMETALNNQKEVLTILRSLVAMHEATHERLDRIEEQTSGQAAARQRGRRTA